MRTDYEKEQKNMWRMDDQIVEEILVFEIEGSVENRRVVQYYSDQS